MKVFAAILVVILASVGWMIYRASTADERIVREAAASALKDPGSAEYRNIRRVGDTSKICGEVNAKNALGAYTGYKAFVVNAAGTKPSFTADDSSDSLERSVFQSLSHGC